MSYRPRLTKKILFRTLIGCSVAVGTVGCSTDVLTYSQDYKRQGMKEFNDGQYDQATGSFAAAVKQDPTDPAAQFYLGESYEATNNLNQAIVAYRLCLNLLPQTPAGRANVQMHDDCVTHLVSVVAKSDQAEQNIDVLEAEAAKNQDPQEYVIVARIFAQRGDPDSAINAYRQALALSPDDFGINKSFGLYLSQMNQQELARPVLLHAYQLNGNDKQVSDALAQAGGVPAPGQ